MNQINRRQFIAAGSFAVAGLAITSDLAFAATAPAFGTLPVAVGFWGGVPRMARRFLSARSTFDAAQTVLTGDPSLFSTGARVSFRGIHRQNHAPSRSIFIDWAQKRVDGPPVPFFAFTHIEDQNGVRTSTPSRFVVGVETEGTLDFAIRSGTAASTVSFAVNSADNALKLNRGTYIFALTDRAPAWNAIRLAEGVTPAGFVTGGKPLLVSALDGQTADFDYVVMTVDAA